MPQLPPQELSDIELKDAIADPGWQIEDLRLLSPAERKRAQVFMQELGQMRAAGQVPDAAALPAPGETPEGPPGLPTLTPTQKAQLAAGVGLGAVGMGLEAIPGLQGLGMLPLRAALQMGISGTQGALMGAEPGEIGESMAVSGGISAGSQAAQSLLPKGLNRLGLYASLGGNQKFKGKVGAPAAAFDRQQKWRGMSPPVAVGNTKRTQALNDRLDTDLEATERSVQDREMDFRRLGRKFRQKDWNSAVLGEDAPLDTRSRIRGSDREFYIQTKKLLDELNPPGQRAIGRGNPSVVPVPPGQQPPGSPQVRANAPGGQTALPPAGVGAGNQMISTRHPARIPVFEGGLNELPTGTAIGQAQAAPFGAGGSTAGAAKKVGAGVTTPGKMRSRREPTKITAREGFELGRKQTRRGKQPMMVMQEGRPTSVQDSPAQLASLSRGKGIEEETKAFAAGQPGGKDMLAKREMTLRDIADTYKMQDANSAMRRGFSFLLQRAGFGSILGGGIAGATGGDYQTGMLAGAGTLGMASPQNLSRLGMLLERLARIAPGTIRGVQTEDALDDKPRPLRRRDPKSD